MHRRDQLKHDLEGLAEQSKRQITAAKKTVSDLYKTDKITSSRLISIRFTIERKSIKNTAREEKRSSIHALEEEK